MTYTTLEEVVYKYDNKVEISTYYYYVIMAMAVIGFVAIIALIVLIVKNHSDWGYISEQRRLNDKIKEEYVNKIKTIKSSAKDKDKKIFELEAEVERLKIESANWEREYYNNRLDSNALANAIKDGIAKAKYEEKTGVFGSADDILDSSEFNRK